VNYDNAEFLLAKRVKPKLTYGAPRDLSIVVAEKAPNTRLRAASKRRMRHIA
jgi:hypothetical protein